ncbi:hypothetical protein [Actinoplanes sp. N902-109]|uniref:hypothetical protein n=1 Tax=Actinoplanes sp. (strain N902-109) TaxID=649831 RepID=UPI00032933F6|nr:hypothetical protein [Actinoplanes sp. N902-109]AGL19817.1 hypothetical protein L083_6307 [Actinoplanes sp. N902-109]
MRIRRAGPIAVAALAGVLGLASPALAGTGAPGDQAPPGVPGTGASGGLGSPDGSGTGVPGGPGLPDGPGSGPTPVPTDPDCTAMSMPTPPVPVDPDPGTGAAGTGAAGTPSSGAADEQAVPSIGLTIAGAVGQPSELQMALWGNPDVTAFGYRLGDADEVVVPAVDGVATTPVVFTAKNTTVSVRAFAGETVIGAASTDFYLTDAPYLGSVFAQWDAPPVGCAGTFWLYPRVPDVQGYRVTFGDEPERAVAADADGQARLTWTSPAVGDYTVVARSVTADGTVSDPAYYSFTVTR